MKRHVTLGVLVVLALTACESPLGPRAGRQAPLLEALPRALSVAEQQLIQANNEFAFGVLRETLLNEAEPNVLLSPVSASFALGMAMNGARGGTLDGMRTALGFGSMDLDAINASYRALIDLLLSIDRGVDMRVANSIWARQGFPFHDSFMQTGRTWFGAEIATLDFNDSDAAKTINRWVDRNTAGRIREIVDDPIDGDMVMFLINAIYFKGNWREQFERSRTQPAAFTLADGSRKQVPMMNRTGTARVHFDQANGVQVLEMLYGRGAFAMTIVVPRDQRSIDDIIDGLTPAQWAAWVAALRDGEASVSLPRFRLEYETTMNVPLAELGMHEAFSPSVADFSAMSTERLYISDVKQKTYIDVNEQGTEAAAVTAVGMRVVSAPPHINVDRPFLLAIRERFSGTILFLGRIGDPAGG